MNTRDKETPITIEALITVTNALAALLAEESQMIGDMKMGAVGELQERKLKLSSLLERYTRHFHKYPEMLMAASYQEKADLRAANDILKKEINVNYEKLLVGRAVNKAIVTCVTGVLSKKASNDLYNASGTMYKGTRNHMPLSVTLNKVV